MIETYFVDTVIRSRPNVDEIGRELPDSFAEYSCRIERTTRAVRGVDGEYKQASYVVFLPSNADVQIGDRLRLPTDSTGDSEWSVQSVFLAKGFSSNHIEVTI